MPHGNTLSRMLIATLAAALIAVPTAMAQPIDPVGTSVQPQTDSEAGQQLQTEHAKQQADAVSTSSATDLRGERAAEPQATSKTAGELRTEAAIEAGKPETKPAPAGLPTWPLHPRVLTPPASTTAVADDGDGGGVDAPIVALIIAGALALGGAAMVAMHRHRTPVAH